MKEPARPPLWQFWRQAKWRRDWYAWLDSLPKVTYGEQTGTLIIDRWAYASMTREDALAAAARQMKPEDYPT